MVTWRGLRNRAAAFLRADKPPRMSPYVRIGRASYGVRPENVWGATADAPLVVGNYCSIAITATFICQEHPLDLPSTYPFRTQLWSRPPEPRGLNADAVTRGPIVLGHDVWIGHAAIVLSGVTIGTGAVIAAGTIVTKDVPPYGVVAGNPARLLKYRFSQELVQELLASKWWELDEDELEGLERHLYETDVGAFLRAVKEYRSGDVARPTAPTLPAAAGD